MPLVLAGLAQHQVEYDTGSYRSSRDNSGSEWETDSSAATGASSVRGPVRATAPNQIDAAGIKELSNAAARYVQPGVIDTSLQDVLKTYARLEGNEGFKREFQKAARTCRGQIDELSRVLLPTPRDYPVRVKGMLEKFRSKVLAIAHAAETPNIFTKQPVTSPQRKSSLLTEQFAQKKSWQRPVVAGERQTAEPLAPKLMTMEADLALRHELPTTPRESS